MRQLYIVDAFTNQPFGGNTAGVVMLEPGEQFPSARWMQQVAAELRYSETAFVRHIGGDEYHLRYFTPTGEVDLCGHATIATFGVLFHEGIMHEGDRCLAITRAGRILIIGGEQVFMTMAMPQVIQKEINISQLMEVMGITAVADDLPVEIVSTGLPDIILPLPSVACLQSLAPDNEALAALSSRLDVVGVHAFAVADDQYTAHVRNFAPRYGIPEESATGTANAALTHYLHRHGVLTPPATCRFIQGEVMGRPSVVNSQLMPDSTILIGGQTVIVGKGVICKNEE